MHEKLFLYLGNMDETTGTPLLQMKNVDREKSINDPHLKSKSMVISPLIRLVILWFSF